MAPTRYREIIRDVLLENHRESLFVSDSGLETTLVFHDQIELPQFASFPLLQTKEGRLRLKRHFEEHARIAVENKGNFFLDGLGWRANADWGAKLGLSKDRLDELLHDSVRLQEEIKNEFENETTKITISGTVGPRSDAYQHEFRMSIEEAKEYHLHQISLYASHSSVDVVTAYTLTYAEEGAGIALAAKELNIPVIISFTIESDGNLPSQQSVKESIALIDGVTKGYPVCYKINCVHPCFILKLLEDNKDEEWVKRIHGLKGNASKKTHAELDESTTLDAGDPEDYGECCKLIQLKFPHIKIIGGCCGTDARHIVQVCNKCTINKYL